MRMLIVTQVVDKNHSNLGFFHEWIREFAGRCEQVHVICLQEGAHELPANVTVHSLGKESQASRTRYVANFFRYIWRLRKEYDAVFVHMNPEYIVLGGPAWRLWGKKIGLWYVHKSVTLRLRIAVALADTVFTVAPESFRLRTPKLRVVGHGIDTILFKPEARTGSDRLRIVTVGRVSRSKGITEMLGALDVLHARDVPFTFVIVGGPLTAKDRSYAEELAQNIASKPYAAVVSMKGPVSNRDMPAILHQADVSLNISQTGGYDKTVLEALACGVPALSSNGPFRALLSPYGLFVKDTGPEALASDIERAVTLDVAPLRAEVEAHHSLSRLIPAIMKEMQR